MALEPDHLARRRSGDYLHGHRRDERCKHHPTLPDDRDSGGYGHRIYGRRLPALARPVVLKHPLGFGEKGENRGGQLLARSTQALHILVGPDWRFFSRAVVFRSGPIAGTTISRRRLAERESARIALQRRSEGADAVFHSTARRNCFHVLPIRKASSL